jgi:hypothetical protein
MDFPVWDVVSQLPVSRVGCAARGDELVSVDICRDGDGTVHTMSFNPSSPWQAQMMAFHVAGAFPEAAEIILRNEGRESSLRVGEKSIRAVLYPITDELAVVASDDPGYRVAVAVRRMPVPPLRVADPAAWRAAVEEAMAAQ